MKNMKQKLWLLFFVLIGAFLLFLVWKEKFLLSDLLAPIILGAVLSYFIQPMTELLHKFKIPEKISIIIVMVLFVAAFLLLVIFGVPRLLNDLSAISETLQSYTAKAGGYLERLERLLEPLISMEELQEMVTSLFSNMKGSVLSGIESFGKNFITSLQNFFSKATTVVLSPVLAYYFLRDKKKIKQHIVSFFSSKNRNSVTKLLDDVNGTINDFFKGQFLVAFLMGVISAAVFTILGVKFALFLGILGGVLNIIPYFGPIISAIPVIILTMITSPEKILLVIIALIGIQQAESIFITPKIVGNSVGLHPVTVILATFAGGKLYGIFGMVLAIPISAVIKVLLKFLFAKIVEV